MARSLTILMCVMAALVISGCATLKTLTTRDDKPKEPKADKPLPLVQFEPEATIRVLWRRSIGRGVGTKFIDLSPSLEESTIYAADGYGFVAAVDRENGKLQWSTRVGRPMRKGFMNVTDRSDPAFVTGGIGTGADMIYLGTARGEVVALVAADGEEQWRRVADQRSSGATHRVAGCRLCSNERRQSVRLSIGRRLAEVGLPLAESPCNVAWHIHAGVQFRHRVRWFRKTVHCRRSTQRVESCYGNNQSPCRRVRLNLTAWLTWTANH